MGEKFHFKKKYGQNFLKNEQILDSIVKKSEIQENALVIEVGPGQGALTKKLASVAKKVICYEIDLELKESLTENLKEYENVSIFYEDFLRADILSDIVEEYDHIYFISNVPYYITTPIIMKLTDLNLSFDKIVMMVQKEVGTRFCSKEGSRDYGFISVYLNYFYDTKKILDVSRKNFIPEPNVDSVVLSLTPKKEKLKVFDFDFFVKLVHDSFQFKRKTIKNNLKNYDLKKVEQVLSKYHYDLNVRAESLSVEIFVEISNTLSK